jgi:mitogen-activated protein kinase 1/3
MIEKDDPILADHHSDFPIDRKDQLKMIFNIMGTPQDDMDVSFISDQQAEDYIQIFASKSGSGLHDKYPNSSAEAIDLLSKMLTFNPYFRVSIDECLNHPFFASVRDLDKEVTASKEIAFAFESEGDLSEARLRELILEEVDHFN